MELGEGLLEKDSPQLLIFSLTESRLTGFCDGDPIIDNNRSQISTDVQLNLVDTSSVDCLRLKELLYSVRILRQSTESAEEVAVAKCTLTNILRFDACREDLRLVEDLTATLPLELKHIRIFTQGQMVGFEIVISPRFSCVDDVLNLFRRLLV